MIARRAQGSFFWQDDGGREDRAGQRAAADFIDAGDNAADALFMG